MRLVWWHHQLDGPEFEKVQVVRDVQENLASNSQWGTKELDTTEQLK